ncbi:membrane protein [Bacillus thuringiensis]|uniref:DUF421 domain-containing protein n=1 Tax=Bacillus thuringiensis YBT-1518 TaxID=529122 RepID=A0A9W3KL10_BACTU|nr:DUF421 domain-containing protein [Bacillus thuringiensis]AHA75477.1 hypothetical protein YBT1518_33961 [Bacillus thuringiensis YBT-1518]MBG9486636.1 membrane protein [Bacillus thuringiensis]MBG9486652.1 membrane protein [Bacillus thuringiensis]MBG9486655.1 membrane protein [Bacillus thuringiensis]MBG9486664.1 membrane protein [Bacillus thuringiensis]
MELYYPAMIKLGLGLLCLIFQIHGLGKNLAPASAMDQVQDYVLGGIIGGVIYNDSIPPLQFFLILIIWTIFVLTITFLKNNNRYCRRLIDGKPIALITNGQLHVRECLRCGISANELMFKLRANGVYELKMVKRAVLELNGQLIIIKYSDTCMHYPLIFDGQANDDVLELIEKDMDWLQKRIQEEGYTHISDIYLGEYHSEELRCYGYHEKTDAISKVESKLHKIIHKK